MLHLQCLLFPARTRMKINVVFYRLRYRCAFAHKHGRVISGGRDSGYSEQKFAKNRFCKIVTTIVGDFLGVVFSEYGVAV